VALETRASFHQARALALLGTGQIRAALAALSAGAGPPAVADAAGGGSGHGTLKFGEPIRRRFTRYPGEGY
jgi:dihydroxyacetone kinase